MSHWQQATFNCGNGIDLFPHEDVFEMGGFVRHDSATSVTVMYKADMAKDIRNVVEDAIKTKANTEKVLTDMEKAKAEADRIAEAEAKAEAYKAAEAEAQAKAAASQQQGGTQTT